MDKELQDKAWAVLPKEFREEVKSNYQQVRQRYEYPASEYDVAISTGAMWALESLFGKHNLTSDADEVKPAELQPDTSQKKPFKVGDTITVSGWTVYSIKPSYIELHKKTCVGMTHVITVNEKDILSFGHQPQELHVGDKVDVTGWKVIRYRNDTLILKREMAYGSHVINLEESDLKRDTFTQPESDKHAINIKGYDNNAARLQAATAAMQGILANDRLFDSVIEVYKKTTGSRDTFAATAIAARMQADALLDELGITGKGDGDERK